MMRSEIDVLSPQTLEEALDLLEQKQTQLKIVAGGSDVIVQLRDGIIKPNKLLSILGLKELRFIKQTNGSMHIGSLATYSDITTSTLTRRHAWILVEAAKQIGAIQLQNTATIGGNLGNASPAGDSLPPLYALDAMVVTRSKSGQREIPIEDYFTGYRKTMLGPDELIQEIHFPQLGTSDRGRYLKLGLREANAISIVDVAVVLRDGKPDGSYAEARVALGAVAPTIVRARGCEKMLTNRVLTAENIREAASLAANDAKPIDDIRGSAAYRKEVVVSLVYQALYESLFGSAGKNE
jgi:CO/xanthine dehydrogenase FAD-binding subunit